MSRRLVSFAMAGDGYPVSERDRPCGTSWALCGDADGLLILSVKSDVLWYAPSVFSGMAGVWPADRDVPIFASPPASRFRWSEDLTSLACPMTAGAVYIVTGDVCDGITGRFDNFVSI